MRTIVRALLVLGLVAQSLMFAMPAAFAFTPGNEPFARTWERTDGPIVSGAVSRTWMWGPQANTPLVPEPYLESPNGVRDTQYFDKSRMELSDPEAVDDGLWYVTNGLLVVELISGNLQIGDDTFLPLTPAEVSVAGDPNDPTGPTYATFANLLEAAPASVGATYTLRLDRAGNLTEEPGLAARGVTAAVVDDVTNHAIAAPFWTFMQSSGLVQVGDDLVVEPLFDSPYYATGRPITEAYWTWVEVGGTAQDVLLQCFERRCLTYTPQNEPSWQVEAGNVGLHYHTWRYESGLHVAIVWITAAEGGSITLNDVTIEIPANALSQDTLVTIVPALEVPEPPDGYVPVGDAYWLGLSGATLTQPVSITLPYDAALLPDDVNSSQVVAGRYGDAGAWALLSGQVSDDSITVTTQTLSIWQAFAPEDGEGPGPGPDPEPTPTPSPTPTPPGEGDNTAPVANAQSVTVDEDDSIAITLTGSDAEDDSLTYEVLTQPSNGTITGTAPNLTYTPDPDFNGTDFFTFRVNDGTVNSAVATISITVAPVNDPPVADDQNVTTDEDAAIEITLTASDIDGDSLTYGVLTQPTNGTLTGTAPNLTYTPDLDFQGEDSFTFVAHDGTVVSNVATVTITVEQVNDQPVVDLNGADDGANSSATFTEGDAAVPIAESDATVTDDDSTTLVSMTVTITNLQDGTAESLAADTTGTSISASYDSATGILALTGSDSLANYQQVLRTITYANTAPNPGLTARVINVVANDGVESSAVATATISIVPVNDAPVVDLNGAETGIDFTTAFVEDGGPVTIGSSDLTVSDVDNANLASATITLTNSPDGDAESLAADTTGTAITAVYDSGTGVLTLTGSDTLANYQTVLRSVVYDNGSQNPDLTSRVVTVVVNDGVLDSATATTTISVSSANDPPVVTLSDSQPTFSEGDASVIVDAGLTVTDPDSANLSGATITLTNPLDASDALTVDATGTSVTVSGNGTSAITLSGDTTLAEYQQVLRTLTFTNTEANPTTTSRTITFVVTDSDGAASNTVTKTVTVVAVNDAPIITVPGDQSVNEDTDLVLAGVDAISVADADAGTNNIELSLTATHGTITLASTSGLTLLLGDGTSDTMMIVSGTLTDINTALDGLSFRGTQDFFGTAAIDIIANDLEHTGSGGAMSTTESISIVVNSVNDAPTFQPGSDVTVDEDSGSYSAAWATDISAGPANESGQSLTFLLTVTGTTGGLTFSATPAISATGTLTFTAAPDSFGTATIDVVLQDNGGTANGGVDTTSPAETFTITVSAVNDAPEVSAPASVEVDEDTDLAFSGGTAISVADIDAGANDVEITLAVENGTLTLNSTTGLTFSTGDGAADATMSFSGSLTDINAALAGLTYRGAQDYSGGDTLSITANDQGNTGSGGAQTGTASVAITVNPVNDAPVLSAIETTSLAYTENDPASVITATLVVSDIDSSNLSGATVSVSSGYVNGEDVLTFVNANGITGTFDTSSGVLTLSGTSSLANYQAALRSVTYTNLSDAPGASKTITFQVDDGGAINNLSDQASRSITITAVNDAPVATVPGAQSVDEDTDLVFTGGTAISIADVDAGSSLIEVTLAAENGTLTLSGTTGLSFSTGDGTADTTMTFTGTLANVNGALAGLIYRGSQDFNSTRGTASLTLTVDDQGNSGTGGALTDTESIAITVDAVNDPPVIADKSYQAQTNMRLEISGDTQDGGLLVGATDPDSGDGAFVSTLTLGTISATTPTGGTVTVTDAATGAFTFDPPPGVTGDVTFTYQVCDNGNPAPAACSTATVTVAVAGAVIWFVNPAAGTNGNGTLFSPFNVLSSADAVDAANHSIFVYTGTATASIALNTNERLIGQGVTGTSFDTVFGISPPAGTIARPAVGGTRPAIAGQVTMATGDTVRGLNITPAAGTVGLSASAATGLTVNEVSVTTTNAVAVNLTSNSDGTFSFTRIDANGGASGIVWTRTSAATGSFTVTGTGSAGSGGTIQNTTGHGISFTSARDVNLHYVNVTGSGEDGIHVVSVTNFRLNESAINNNGNSTSGDGLQFGEASGTVVGVIGTVTISNTSISGNAHNNVHLRNTSGTLSEFNVTNSTFNDLNDVTGANSFLVEMSGTAILTSGTVSGSTFSNNSPQRAMEVQTHDTGTISSFVVTGSTFNNNGIHASFTQDSASNLNFTFSSNNLQGADPLQAINVFSSSQSTGGTIVARIESNTIGTLSLPGSGSTTGPGIRVLVQGLTDATLAINSNIIRQTPQSRGIDVQFIGPLNSPTSLTHDATVTNNDVIPFDTTGFPLSAIYLAADNQNTGSGINTVRFDVRGNTVPAGTAFDMFPTYLIVDEVTTNSVAQLVDSSPVSTDCTDQLTSANTGSAQAHSGCSLISGPINLP